MPKPPPFDDWIKPHLSALMRISRGFADPADQPDLLQELMIALWKAQPSFRGDSAVATFVYRVAHNRALTWKKRQTLNILRFFQARHDLANLFSPHDSRGQAAQLDALYAAIRQLSPVDRSLMLLWLDQVPYADMAALHGLTESHVGARLTRARQKLSVLTREVRDES